MGNLTHVWVVYDTSDVLGAIACSIWTDEVAAQRELKRKQDRAKQIGFTFTGTVMQVELNKADVV